MDLNKLKNIFVKMQNSNISQETYSLSLITTWLRDKNIPFKYASSCIDRYSIYEHGIRIQFEGFDLSIQTHPMIAGWAFVETLRTDMMSDTRHKNPEVFFNFLENLMKEEKLKENIEEEDEQKEES